MDERAFVRTAAMWLACQWQLTHARPALRFRVYDPLGTIGRVAIDSSHYGVCMARFIQCDWCLTRFAKIPRIKDQRFCTAVCRRAWHKAGPSVAGKKREALLFLIRTEVEKILTERGVKQLAAK